jgi:transcriptional regulator with XRE-family HTH domain
VDDCTLTAAQIRAGRGLLDWSQARLAEAASVGLSTVRDFEAGRRTPYRQSLDAMRRALEDAGVDFIPQNGGGAGVRLREAQPPA